MNDKFAYRRGKIGSSDAPIISGVSPWTTPLQLWEEKLGLREPRPTNSYMQRGIDKEEEARCAFEQEMGVVVLPQVLTHPEHPWMIASLDGLSVDGDIAVEIKCPGEEDHQFSMKYREPPRKYFPQLQHQLAVSGLDMMYYFSYRPDHEHVMLQVNRDDAYIQLLINKEIKFYECMQDYTPPGATCRDLEIRTDEAWLKLAGEWKACSNMIHDLREIEAVLKEEMISICGDKACCGGGVTLRKVARKGSIDYEEIIETCNLVVPDIEKYRKKPSISWRITKSDEDGVEDEWRV